MTTPPFHIFDTMLGDRVLDTTAVIGLLQGAPTSAFASPPPIGNTTPNEGHFTTLEADDVTVNGGMSVNGVAQFTESVEVSGTSSFSGVTEFTDRVISALPLTLSPGAATATAGAATINGKATGVVTSESLTTAAGSTYALTITDDVIQSGDMVHASVAMGTATKGFPVVGPVQVTSGAAVVSIRNAHASDALNGTITVAFAVFRGNG